MRKRINKPLKLIYLVMGVICLMLGVIGLVVPIIPGILFLMAAVYLFGRASKRIKRFTEKDPRIRQMQQRLEEFGDVNVPDRIRLAGCMTMDAAIKSTNAVGRAANQVVRTVSRKVSSC